MENLWQVRIFMDENYKNKKIKIAIIGTGSWGSKVLNAINLISRFEIVGTINSSTSIEDKKNILNTADVLYIALHPEYQMEYMKYGIDNDKHIVCESPFLNSLEERKLIYEEIIKKNNNKFIYINYPYVQDTDFVHLCKMILLSKSKFISIKAFGPDIRNSLEKAKKIYSNQAIYILGFLHFLTGRDKLENFNILNSEKGYTSILNGVTYEFSWEISNEPKLELEFKNENFSDKKVFYYDQYDQIVPLLLLLSNRIYNIFPPTLDNVPEKESIWLKLILTSYLSACSAEYFSDIFTNIKESDLPFFITNPLNLYLNGGFNQ